MFDIRKYQSGQDILIPPGIHYVTEPIVLSESNLHIRGEEGTILRGTMPLKREDFTEEAPGVWTASAPHGADALYIGSRKYTMARYPKAHWPGDVFDGYAADCIDPAKTADWADPAGGYIHAMHKHGWGDRIDGNFFHTRVRRKPAGGSIQAGQPFPLPGCRLRKSRRLRLSAHPPQNSGL